MSNTDRVVRLLISVIFAALYFTETVTGTLGIVLVILAVVFAFTAVFSFCPLYAIVGFSTCQTKK